LKNAKRMTTTTTTTVKAASPSTKIIIDTTTIDDLTHLTDDRDKTFVIILAVTLPTLALIGILILLFICYRRRHATIWLKKIEHSSRLQAIVVNLSSTPLQAELSGKKVRLSHRTFSQPRTETIVYNRLSTPSTPVFLNPFSQLKSSTEGETNAAFDEFLPKNDQPPPILRSTLQPCTNLGQHTTTLHNDFPVSLQAPVRTITSSFVEAIAAHRLSLLIDTSNTTSSLETTTNPRHSGTSSSYSTGSHTVLLFSQRTEL